MPDTIIINRLTTKGIITFLLAFTLSFPAVMAAVPGNASAPALHEPDLELSITNTSFNPSLVGQEYAVTPTPIEVIRLISAEENLPGPRYMAFGPSVVSISIDPGVIVVCFALVLIGLIIWFVCFRGHGSNGGKDGENK